MGVGLVVVGVAVVPVVDAAAAFGVLVLLILSTFYLVFQSFDVIFFRTSSEHSFEFLSAVSMLHHLRSERWQFRKW